MTVSVGDLAQSGRLPQGGLIDRSRPLSFHFDGHRYGGYAGDTLAAALLAAGVRLVGRSFKYHRPRGTLSAGPEEPNALVELRSGARREPNTRATTVELFDGLLARSQNRWPSLAWDFGAINSLFAPLLPAGFYYKTFMWPAAFWERVYEPLIRRAAGLGRASLQADPDTYEKSHAFCDLLVIGGGPAGLSAALSAARSGARVIVCEEDFVLGGRLHAERHAIDGMSGTAWAQQAAASLMANAEVRVLLRTSVFGVYDSGTLGAIERVADHQLVPACNQPRQRLWKIVARHIVLATGAIEQPIVFDGNDRPGVMLASAVRTYVNRFAVPFGPHAVVFTATDDGWKTARDLVSAGSTVTIVDARAEVPASLRAMASSVEAQTLLNSRVVGTRGARGVHTVLVQDAAGRCLQLQAGTLAISGGWSPNFALATHLGGRPRWSEKIAAFVPGDRPHNMTVIGAAGGTFNLAEILREGASVGAHAAQALGFHASAAAHLVADDEPTALTPVRDVRQSRGKAFVDFQHDVTAADIALAVREGFRSPELLKRYTTLGMGTDQGKTSIANGMAMLAAATGRPIAEVGVTTFRPPCLPVAIGALAGVHRGRQFRPTRLTAAHDWARAAGATFIEAGQWLRVQWFAAPDESDWLTSVVREVRTVRSSVGVCDVSTLGKIDIQGPDAGQFLDRIYINMFSTLPVGKVRYGLMLREDGFAFDDGTSARLAAEHYLMTTTTANAGAVMQHLEHARQVMWPELDVQIVSVTEQWTQYAIAGPNSRRLLQRLLGDAIELGDAAFPYLACAQFTWQGVPCRLFRVSFSGELAYELAVPARYGDAALRALMAAGAPWGVVPYGTEALGVMRIEKGHVAGNELNGTTTAADLGLGRMMSTKKDFIGRVLSAREGLTDPGRQVLVGLKPLVRDARLHAGAHLLSRGVTASLSNDHGYVTSVAFSPTLGHWIGLGLLARGAQRHGECIRAYDALRGGDVEVEVVPPVFLDVEGTRLRS